MAVTSNRTILIEFSGDFSSEIIQAALQNDNSPGDVYVVTLIAGPNNVFPPSVPGLVVNALTIIPPAGNIEIMILKGVAGDTGIILHPTDPTTISLDPGFAGLVIDAGGQIDNVRYIWS